ncbi:WEB family protein At5g16730, chloroplastic-like [Nicotiana sylvestris]|uniref:WEB family protein At5g16730, chloroplastic-like n=1 Tax=Nicotiana sylvestris TaxID=4096 RepID=UPI00388CBB25
MVGLLFCLCLRLAFLSTSLVLTNYGYRACAGLGENMDMRLPPGGGTEVSEPGKGKKRGGKADVDPSVAKKPRSLEYQTAARTSTSPLGANHGTEDEDVDECQLARKTRSSAGASQVPQSDAVESGTADLGRSRRSETLEGGVDMASDRMTGFGRVSSGELMDAQEANIVKAGIPLKGGGPLANIFDSVSNSVSRDILGAVKECNDMYDHALFRLREELSYREKECKKLTSMLRDSQAHSSRGEKELGELRAALERALREKADLVAQVEQNGSQISRLNVEILGLRKQSEVATEELASSHDLLKNARKEVATLVATKSEIERNVATYLDDAATAFNKFKSELLHYEAPLREALGRGKSLKLLCAEKESELVSLWRELNVLIFQLKNKEEELGQLWGEIGLAKHKFNELQVYVSTHFAAKESALDIVSALEVQIQTVRVNDSARANMITSLLSELPKAKVEVVNVWAEVGMSKTGVG